jgi:hypothetical protein
VDRAGRAEAAFWIAILAGVLFIAFLGPLTRRLEMVHYNDFSGFWSGPRSAILGVDPWDPERYAPTAIAIGTKTPDALVYDYMPWVMVALLPFGALDLEVAAWVWMILSMACATIALRALLRTFVPGRPLVHGLLGLALFVGQPGFHSIVLGQWAHLLMAATAVVVLSLRAGHARRAAFAALAFLAKPQVFVWAAVGLAVPAFVDERYRRFVIYAIVLAGALVVSAWLAYPDWFSAWLADIPARRTDRSAVLTSALGQLLGPAGRVLAVALIGAGVLLASRFKPGSDPWLAVWLALSSAGAIYSWSYNHVLLFVPLLIACGVLAAAGRERTLTLLALGAAVTLLVVSLLFYAIAVARHDETFSVLVPLAFFGAIAWSMWPYRGGASARERAAQQVQAA